MKYSRIAGTGSYLPEKILTNADLEKMIDTSDAWITERTGIRERRIAGEHETTSTMASAAGRMAIEAAQIDKNAIDLIIVATATPDKILPSTACLVQEQLGIRHCAAFDANAACSGFNYALGIADSFIRCEKAKCVLVIGSELLSRVLDWTDRGTCILFGDGAGAVVLTASDEPGILSTHLYADGHFKDLLYTSDSCTKEGRHIPPYIKMEGNSVFKIAVNNLEQLVVKTLEANHLTKSEIDWLIPHQANLRIIQAIAKKLDLSLERVIVTVDKHANTSAASVPLALDTGIRDGRIKRGNKLILESFGGGITWASALIVY